MNTPRSAVEDGSAQAPVARPGRGLLARLGRLWSWCVAHPRLALVLAVALHTLPVLWVRDLWSGDEVRHGDVLRGFVNDGHVLVLHLNGEPYPDKPPLWFALVGALAFVTGSTAPWTFFLAAAVSAVTLAWTTWSAARAVAGRSGGSALAPALATTVVPLVALLARTTRMDLLFATFITAASTALFRGLAAGGGPRATVAGFAWGALACWTKGPFGLVLPLGTAVGFLLWRGRLARLLSRDVALGALAALGLVGAWAVGVAWVESPAFLRDLLSGQVVERFARARHHREPFWFYAAALAPCVLPWSLLPLALPWRPAGWRARLSAALSARRSGDPGHAWLVASVVSGLLLLSITSMKFFIYLAPLVPPILILSTQALERADGSGRARFAVLAGWVGLLAAAALPALALLPISPLRPLHLLPLAVVLAGASLLLLSARRAPFGPLVLASTLGLSATTLAAAGSLPPVLEPRLCPRGTAERLVELAATGHAPIAYGLYPGQLSYHASRRIAEAGDLERLAALVAREPRSAVVLPVRRWPSVKERLPGLRLLYEHPLLDGPLYVAVIDVARSQDAR